MKKIILLVMIFIMTICVSGCSGNKQTEYTIEEIKQKIAPDGGGIDKVSDKDCTEQALYAYNTMLTHVETFVGTDDYYIYDFDIGYFDGDNKYFIKIVLKDWYTEYEAIRNSRSVFSDNEMIIILTCHAVTGEIESQLEPFLMAESWREDLTAEVAEKFPDYHINIYYSYLYYYKSNPELESYSEDTSDYTYFLNEEDFYKTNGESGDNNSINLFLPPGTTQKQMDVIFEEMKPLLHKYCVTKVITYVLTDDESLNELLTFERFTGNDFYLNNDFSLQYVYYITE